MATRPVHVSKLVQSIRISSWSTLLLCCYIIHACDETTHLLALVHKQEVYIENSF